MVLVAEQREQRQKKRTSRPRRRGTTRAVWWGAGPPPHVQWPGVTIEIPAVWSTAWQRWESPDGRYYFDQEEADRAREFFPTYLSHHIGEFAGRPFELLEYQATLLTRPIFGWKQSKDGFRRFRKIFAFIPKGGGKSPWASATGLYMMLCDREPAAEVYAVAADRAQARTVHDNAKIMVEQSPDLAAMCEVLRDSIYCPATRSTYKVMSADAKTKHGVRPHCVIFDEFHAQPTRDLYEAMKKSTVKRRQPLIVLISHAGDDDEGVCFEEYEYAKGILTGRIEDDTCLPVIFEASPDDDFTDPKVWARVNPGHGITVKVDGIAQECQEAINEPRKRNDFLRFHLNRWVNQAVAWIPIDWWDQCQAPVPSDAVLATMPGAVGIDMAQKIDLASAVAVFRLPLDDAAPEMVVEVVSEQPDGEVVKTTRSLNYRIAVVPAFWLPEETLRDRVKQDHVPYDQWRDATPPLLHVTNGAVIDSEAIVAHCISLTARFPMLKESQFGYDPAFATEIGVRLTALGLTAVEVLQNYKHLTEACQVFEALVKAKRVLHGGHRLLRWNVENVAVKRDDAGRIRPVKPKKAAKRIDGVVALLIALNRLISMPERSDEASHYFATYGLTGMARPNQHGIEA